MTKAQIKAALQKVYSKVFEKKFNDDSISKLQNLNSEFGSGNKWCSYQLNLVEIIKGGDEKAIAKALNIYEEYYKAEGALEAMNEVAKATNCMDF